MFKWFRRPRPKPEPEPPPSEPNPDADALLGLLVALERGERLHHLTLSDRRYLVKRIG